MNKKLIFLTILMVVVASFSVLSTLPAKVIDVQLESNVKLTENEALSLVDFEVFKAELKENKQIGKDLWVLEGKNKKTSFDANTGELVSFLDMAKKKEKSLEILSLDKVKQILKEDEKLKLSRAEDVGQYYLFRWTQNTDGIEIKCNNIVEMVNKNTGETFAYSKVTHDVPDLKPKVESKDAVSNAVAYFNENVDDVVEKTETELVVDLDEFGSPKLMWAVKIYSSKPYSGYWHEISVDAKTGIVLKYDALK